MNVRRRVDRVLARPGVSVVTVPLAVLVIYLVVPVDSESAPLGVLAGILISAAALASVVRAVFLEVRGAQQRLSGWHLLLALEVALLVFSFVYYFVETYDHAQFAGLHTRLDALYFSTATATTVGFGDVHATGQLARGVVTLHMVFNIVFVAAVVNLAKDRMSERRSAARHDSADGEEGPPDEEV